MAQPGPAFGVMKSPDAQQRGGPTGVLPATRPRDILRAVTEPPRDEPAPDFRYLPRHNPLPKPPARPDSESAWSQAALLIIGIVVPVLLLGGLLLVGVWLSDHGINVTLPILN